MSSFWPRRYPLLGENDPNSVKQERAFTMQAEQSIWDIGKPTETPQEFPMQESKFAKGMKAGEYPFEQDHTGDTSVPKLAWLTELQNLDYSLLMPELIEGLTDKRTFFAQFASLALTDLIRHGPLEKLSEALPTITLATKNAFNLHNMKVTRRVLNFLKQLCTMQPRIGPQLSYYMRDILCPLNVYMKRCMNLNDQIVYKPSIHNDLFDEIDAVVQLFLRISADEFDTAEKNIKLAVPTYQIDRDTVY